MESDIEIPEKLVNECNELNNINTKNKVKNKFSGFWFYDENGIKKYNVEKIIENLSVREGKGLVRDVCSILNEERRDLLEKCFMIIGKSHFLSLVEKSFKIQNEGGITKTLPQNKGELEEKKSSGGILFKLLKTEGGLSKQDMKEIFVKDYKARNQRRKLEKQIERLSI
jgi:hypothetical protein